MTSQCLLESQVSKRVLRSSFPTMSALDICVLMNENSSFLFSSFFRNQLFQSPFGIGVLPSLTLVRGPFTHHCCVRDLRLFSAG